MTLYEKALNLKPGKNKSGELVNGLERATFLCLVWGGFTDCEVVHNNWGKPRRLFGEDYKIWKDAKVNRNKLFTAIRNGSIWEVEGLGPKRIKDVCEWLENTENDRQIP